MTTPTKPLTHADLERMRKDAERIKDLRSAVEACGPIHGDRWRAEEIKWGGDPGAGVWEVVNDEPHPRDRYDIFEDPPEAVARFTVDVRNTPMEEHVLVLLAEVERFRQRESNLVADLERKLLGYFGHAVGGVLHPDEIEGLVRGVIAIVGATCGGAKEPIAETTTS